MCGKETSLFRAVIEGTQLKVCGECGKFGRVIDQIRAPEKENKKKIEKQIEEELEIIEGVVPDYSKKVKDARESLGLKQEALAKKINEKESVIHKIETGHYEPNLALAKKIEKFLNITLIEEQEIEKVKEASNPSSSGSLTIGDLLKVKK